MKNLRKNTKKTDKEPKRVRSPVIKENEQLRFAEDEKVPGAQPFSFITKSIALMLFGLFLLQPIGVVLASDEEGAFAESVEESEGIHETITLDSTSEEVFDGPTAEEVVEEAALSDVEEVVVSEDQEDVVLQESGDSSEENVTTTSTEETVEGNISEEASVEEDNDEEVITEAIEEGQEPVQGEEEDVHEVSTSTQPTEEVVIENDTSEDEALDSASTTESEVEDIKKEESAASSTASSTEEVGVVQPLVMNEINDSNRYQFGVDECVTVENGFFYCSKNTVPQMTAEDKVYAAQDADGDYEIFISKDGVDTQITHNVYDDSAPQYDPKSNRLAWHALIEDRYQIMVFDFDEEKMEQLTKESYNSMEPAVLGERIVWQSWIVNNWEIILEENGVRTQLTSNKTHDIDPHIRGSLISWQSQDGDERNISIYNLETKELEVIKGAGGATAANPRFLLVYDTTEANGDVATLGYDLETGEIVPLRAVPGAVPEEIPEPEHAKEKGAFVQINPSIRDEGDGEGDDMASSTPTIVSNPPVEDLAVSEGDIVVASSTDILPPVPDPVGVETLDMTGSTVADPLSGVEVSIPDLVIPPYTQSEITESTLQ